MAFGAFRRRSRKNCWLLTILKAFHGNFLFRRGAPPLPQHQTSTFFKNFREITNLETTSNERMAKSELNAAEKMNMAGIERIKAVLETLNEGHKLSEVREFAIYYSDSAIYTIYAIVHINSWVMRMLCVSLSPLSVHQYKYTHLARSLYDSDSRHPPSETWIPHI